MSDQENSNDVDFDDDDEIFGALITDEQSDNHRSAVRYVRDDISASLQKHGLFKLSKKTDVKLLDISSKGAAIECEKKLKLNDKIILELIFADFQEFAIEAKIVYQAENKKQYGIKFDRYNHELGDYLLSSQNDLIFK